MSQEIQRVLVLSTSHITEDEARVRLPEILRQRAHFVIKYDEGWFVWVPTDDINCMIAELHVLAPLTHALVLRAGELGCQWLRLDSDGPVQEDEFEVYDW